MSCVYTKISQVMGVEGEFRERHALALKQEIVESGHLSIKTDLCWVKQVWLVNHDIPPDEIYVHVKSSHFSYFRPCLDPSLLNNSNRHHGQEHSPGGTLDLDDISSGKSVNGFFDDAPNGQVWSILFYELSTLKMDTLMIWRYCA